MNKQHPILSVVVVVRNDDYGGDFDRRFHTSMDALFRQAEQFKVAVELVLVYYNPLPKKASMTERIRFPFTSEYLTIRLVTVPPEIHAAFLADEKVKRKPLPVLEFIAKNVGIRRASAPFVLSTNADIVLDDRLFAWICTNPLSEKVLYRTNRFDFEFENGHGNSNRTKKKVTKLYCKYGQYRKPAFFSLGFFERFAPFAGKILRGYALLISRFGFLRKYRSFMAYTDKSELFLTEHHYNACGDFTLLHKSVWELLRGYPEDTYSAMHTDSLLMSAALASGLKEKILPFPVYHQQHTNTFEHNAPDYYEDVMFKRLISDSNRMFKEQKPLTGNDESWGLGNIKLEEIRLL